MVLEIISAVLSILASGLSIVAVIIGVKNASSIRKIKGSIKSGDNSVNNIGSENRITNGKN